MKFNPGELREMVSPELPLLPTNVETQEPWRVAFLTKTGKKPLIGTGQVLYTQKDGSLGTTPQPPPSPADLTRGWAKNIEVR